MILTLSDLIAQVESNGNPYAVRFEPGYKPSPDGVARMAKSARCSQATAAVMCAMSWGLFQIMGDNLVSLGLDCSPLEYCANPVKQVSMFERFTQSRTINYSLDEIKGDHFKRERFALRYNGPANVARYSERMLSFLTQGMGA